jgi:hypothetical protein
MPLRDHFHPPLSVDRHWESLHAAWSGSLADALNRVLPEQYFAEEHVHFGPSDDFEIKVFSTSAGLRLVAIIDLVSPRNKDKREARRAYGAKGASYLHQEIGLIVIDIVTNHHANLHNETMQFVQADSPMYIVAESQYAVAYRPKRRQDRHEVDVWSSTFAVGQVLPVLPLVVASDLILPVDLEATYMDACSRRRLV